jgi:hypothetical protein
MTIVFGVFCVLHGVVHLLYFGQSARYFELQPGMVWPDGAWAFAMLSDESTRMLANIALIVAGLGFAAGGAGVLLHQGWWRALVVGAAAFSTLVYALLWNGKMQQLPNQGWVGILINVALLVAVLVLQWPDFAF